MQSEKTSIFNQHLNLPSSEENEIIETNCELKKLIEPESYSIEEINEEVIEIVA